jgi:hypothetical protein
MIRGSTVVDPIPSERLGINLVSEILASGTYVGTIKWDNFSIEDLGNEDLRPMDQMPNHVE